MNRAARDCTLFSSNGLSRSMDSRWSARFRSSFITGAWTVLAVTFLHAQTLPTPQLRAVFPPGGQHGHRNRDRAHRHPASGNRRPGIFASRDHRTSRHGVPAPVFLTRTFPGTENFACASRKTYRQAVTNCAHARATAPAMRACSWSAIGPRSPGPPGATPLPPNPFPCIPSSTLALTPHRSTTTGFRPGRVLP